MSTKNIPVLFSAPTDVPPADFSATVTYGATFAEVRLQRLCPADLSRDAVVDDTDFGAFVGYYNILDCSDPVMPPGCQADLNADAVVDDADFQLFIAAYDALLCP